MTNKNSPSWPSEWFSQAADNAKKSYENSDAGIRDRAEIHYHHAMIREDERRRLDEGRLRVGSGLWFFSLVFKTFFAVVKNFWATLGWIVFYYFVGIPALILGVLTLAAWIVVRQLEIAPGIEKTLSQITPVTSDISRLRKRREKRRRRELGNLLLREMRIVPERDMMDYQTEADLAGGWWTFTVGVAGVTTSTLKKKLDDGLAVLNAADYRIKQVGNSSWEISFYTEPQPWFLDQPQAITSPLPINWDKGMTVPIAYTEDNEQRAISFSGVAGMVVAGIPGSGKSALINTLVTPMCADERVAVSIMDGKGGSDLQTFQPYCDYFNNDDQDFDEVIRFLEEKQELMRSRIKTNKKRTGSSNFWHTPLSGAHRAEIIVIDECQNFFETSGEPKDIKTKKERIIALVRDLVKKGRSAGMCTILVTQKPDSQAVPTSIRDLCSRRICFRVTTPEMTTMILGALPEDAPQPTDIPDTRKGGAVMASDTGEFESIRSYYLDENDAETWLAVHGTKTATGDGEHYGL